MIELVYVGKAEQQGQVFKAVLGMVLSLCVLIAAAPVIVNADGEPHVVDPTGKSEGYAAFLYDNTTGLPSASVRSFTEGPDGDIVNIHKRFENEEKEEHERQEHEKQEKEKQDQENSGEDNKEQS